MTKARSANREEFKETTDLINKVFRISRNHKPTMVEEFPLLLNEDNIDNMIVISKDRKIVSDVNYVIQKVSIQGKRINVAAIGAVCTDPGHEGKRYSSTILDHVESKMFTDGVDLVTISGTRSLYTRRNCSRIKSFYKYTMYPSNVNINLEIEDFNEDDLDKMINLYNQNSTRFIRTKDEFKKLLYAATIPWGNFEYKRLVIKKDREVVGYIIFRIINEGSRIGKVLEMEVDTKYSAYVLKHVSNKYELENIEHYVHIKNSKNQFEGYDKRELDYLDGTLKIINYEQLCEKLRTYFNQYIEDNILSNIQFKQNDGKYSIKYKDEEELVISDVDKLNKLFFGYSEDDYKDLSHLNNICSFAKKVFPIDFVWTSNLNYQ